MKTESLSAALFSEVETASSVVKSATVKTAVATSNGGPAHGAVSNNTISTGAACLAPQSLQNVIPLESVALTSVADIRLAKGFRTREQFESKAGYSLLPFRFLRWDENTTLLTNFVGEYLLLPQAVFADFVRHRLSPQNPHFADLKGRHFLYDATSSVALDLLAAKYRTQYSGLANFTCLHLFVVSLRCDHSCPYCQVSRVSQDKAAFDMTPETADKALDLVFQSPSPYLKIEFQGGESLLNFPLVRYIVQEAKKRNDGRRLEFVIATNLSPLADDTPEAEEILAFCREENIAISTSLDGPPALHNANRPRHGNDSHQRFERALGKVRAALGRESAAALMTTTARSLEMPREIIDEYRRLGFASVFLRPISPFGFAVKSAKKIGYQTEAFLEFYRTGLEYIIELNRQGIPFREDYASIVLGKALSSRPNGYVDLQSPAGLGTAVLVYNYDGDVYASDEGRMLAEVGDTSFRLGNVHRDSYETIMLDSPLLPLVHETMTEAIPGCTDCAFLPWCGTDPVLHHATQGDAIGHRPTSSFCTRNMGVFRLLIELMESDPYIKSLFRRWARS